MEDVLGSSAEIDSICRQLHRSNCRLRFVVSTEHRSSSPLPRVKSQLKFAMKTQGEIEAAICKGIAHFEQEYMGRGPKNFRTHLIDDLLVVRLHGVLTVAEQQLVKTLAPEKGRDLLNPIFSR